MLGFEATLAYRHLRSGGGQTLLTVSAVAVGVIAIVFISSLIFGARRMISSLLTDILPHVTVSPLESEPQPLDPGGVQGDRPERLPPKPPQSWGGWGGTPDRPIISSRIERQSQQRKEIENWPQAVEVIRGIPHVIAVAPAVTGQGFVSRGSKRLGVQVFGANPEQLDAVTSVTKYVFSGHYLGLEADEIVLSYKIAQELGVAVGDRVRLASTESLTDSFLVAGFYDTGQEQSFGSRAYITLRAAQSLYGTGTAVQSILVAADQLFAADQVADRIAALLPYKAESWSRLAPQVVSGLNAQAAVAFLISGLSLAASAFAIASILIVSVVQKSKQIGILKSMGAKGRQILLVFTLEGLGIALVGSTIGAAVGSLVVWALSLVKQPVTRVGGPPQPLLPSALTWQLLAAAMLAATISTVLAAILPARRAARLDPVQVMR
jgi:lipoprotein-releasing system permease protein